MKKIKQIIIVLILMMFSPFIISEVDAAGNGITVNYSITASQSKVNVGGTVDISIKVSGHTKKIASNDITLTYDATKFQYERFTTPSNVQMADRELRDKGGQIIYSYVDFSGGSNCITSDTIVTYTFKALSTSNDVTGSFAFSVKGVADENADSYTLGSSSGQTSVTVHIPSTNNYLESISLSNGSLSPAFNKNTTKYTATVEDSSVTITAKAENGNAKITGAGKKSLDYGENNFTILVTSESGSEKAYVVTITRPDYRNSDNTLSSLSVTNIDFKFNKNKYAYDYTVPNNITSVNVSGQVNNSKSTVTGLGNYNLKVGKNNIVVKVTAENETSKSYVITITREKNDEDSSKTESSNNYLSSLKVEGATFVFNKDTLDYEMSVPYSQNKLVIDYKTQEEKALVEIVGEENLIIGNNTIAIIVTAENGEQRTYHLTIIRDENVTATENSKEAIINSINGGNASIIVAMQANENAISLDEELLSLLKENNQTLIFEWKDQNNVVQKRLTIIGNKLENLSSINPNITSEIKNNDLINYINGQNYIGINTNNTNIPKSKFKIKIDSDITTYNLNYYVNGSIMTKALNVIDGYIEFDIEKDMEYALVGIASKSEEKFNWVFLVLVIVILALLFAIAGVLVVRKYKNDKTQN